MSRLLIALREQDHRLVPVFSGSPGFTFLATTYRGNLASKWQYAKRDEDRHWHEIAIDDPSLSQAVRTLLGLSLQAGNEPLEHMLDYLLGTATLQMSGGMLYR